MASLSPLEDKLVIKVSVCRKHFFLQRMYNFSFKERAIFLGSKMQESNSLLAAPSLFWPIFLALWLPDVCAHWVPVLGCDGAPGAWPTMPQQQCWALPGVTPSGAQGPVLGSQYKAQFLPESVTVGCAGQCFPSSLLPTWIPGRFPYAQQYALPWTAMTERLSFPPAKITFKQ